MLCFDDKALARLAIAATAIPVRMRGRWLRQLAAQLEPPRAISSACASKAAASNGGAARTRLYRSRLASGRAVLRVEVDFNATSGALFAAGLLSEAEIDDEAAISRALERVIDLLPARLNGDV